MKKTFFTLLFTSLFIMLFAQQREKTGFSFDNLMKSRQTKGDTIWQFHRYDVYKWIDNEYFLLHTAFVDWDSLSPNYKTVLWIDNNVTDTAFKVFYSYDDSNRIISTVYQEPVDGVLVNYSKKNQFYNSHGYDSLYLFYMWNSNDSVWEKNKLRSLIYDKDDRIIDDTTCVWDGDKWKISDGYRRDFMYNEFGNVVERKISYYHSEIHQWVNDSKTEYFLINDTTGEYNAYTVYFWKNNRWVNGEKWTDVVCHNWNGFPQYQPELEFDILQLWDGTRWYYEKKDSTIYYPQGDSKTIEFHFDEANEQWHYGLRINQVNYETGFRKLSTLEFWRNEQWDTINGDRYTYEYLNPDFWKVMNYEKYDTAMSKWEPAYKHVFSEFTYVLNTPEYKKNRESSELRIIPNPSKNAISIEPENKTEKLKTVALYNMEGKCVTQKDLNGMSDNTKIDISHIKNGVYIVNALTKSGRMLRGKFVKQ